MSKNSARFVPRFYPLVGLHQLQKTPLCLAEDHLLPKRQQHVSLVSSSHCSLLVVQWFECFLFWLDNANEKRSSAVKTEERTLGDGQVFCPKDRRSEKRNT